MLRVTRSTYLVDTMFHGEVGHVSVYLVVGDGGEAVLVETGPSVTIDNVVEAIEELGVKLRGVIVTHIHLDHAGGAWRIAEEYRVPVYVHPRGLRHLANPERLCRSAREVLGDDAVEYVGCPKPIDPRYLRETSDGMVVEVGGLKLKIVHTPGHANHHQSILLEDEGVVFTGDSLGMYICGCIVPVTPPPVKLDMLLDSIDKMLRFKPTVAAFTHYGVAPDPARLTEELRERISQWLRIGSLDELFSVDYCAARVERVRRGVPYFEGEVERSWRGLREAAAGNS